MLGKQDYLKRFHQPASWDIEDLVQAGRKQVACPYFATRLLLEESLIVFCPYNYLIDPVIRREMKFQLDDQVCISNILFLQKILALLQWSLRMTDTSGTGLLSVVERCPLLGDYLSIRSTDLNSIRATGSVRCRGLSASRDARFGRLHCIRNMETKFL